MLIVWVIALELGAYYSKCVVYVQYNQSDPFTNSVGNNGIESVRARTIFRPIKHMLHLSSSEIQAELAIEANLPNFPAKSSNLG